jgi:diguanylate cyclase (GGDEF)-like protein
MEEYIIKRNQADIMEKDTIKMFDLETYRTLIEYNGDILFEWDLETDRFFVTPNWFDIFGYMPSSYHFSEELENPTMIHLDDIHLFKEYIKTIHYNQHDLANKKLYSKLELRFRNAYHQYIWCKLRLATTFSSRNLPYKISGMITDIDFDKKHRETLLDQAQRDLLTGLYNKVTTHTLIEDYLHSSSTTTKHALMIIDLDGFKAINDNFGHLFGDAVICDLATSIKKSFPSSDIVGRVGGDEFVVLVKNVVNGEWLRNKALALNIALRRSYITDHKEYKISGSIGIAIYPIHCEKFNDLFKAADHALYYAKETGKDKYVIYYPQLPKVEYQNPRINSEANLSEGKKSFHDNLTEYIFKLLYSSVDNAATIKIILEVLGKRFNVSRAFIYERSYDGNHYSIAFQWCNQNIAPIEHSLKILAADKVEKLYAQLNQQNMLNCSNVNMLTAKQREFFELEDIKAFLHRRIIDNGIPRGCVGFDECTSARNWTTEEIDILTFFSDMLTTFLIKKNAVKKTKEIEANLIDILHHVDAWLYVVDKDSYDVLFVNKKLNSCIDQNEVRFKCYQILNNRETPCTDCPMNDLSLNTKQSSKEIYNKARNMWLKVTASKITWKDCVDPYLIQRDDITAQKQL